MLGYAQFMGKELYEPNPIVQKGKYALDKKVKLALQPLNFEGRSPVRQLDWNDAELWQDNEKDFKDMIQQGIFQDHDCDPEEPQFRCKVCGKTLKWCMYGNNRIQEPFDIRYYDYSAIIMKAMKPQDLCFSNFTDIRYLPTLRDYVYFILNRPEGCGFTEIQEREPKKIPKSIRYLHGAGQMPYQMTFFADFESANLGKIIWSECGFSNGGGGSNSGLNSGGSGFMTGQYEAKIILNSDTNTKGFTQWFYFGVKVNNNLLQPVEVRFIILNNRKAKSLFQQGMQVMVGSFYQKDPESGERVVEWRRDGFEIQYKRSEYPRKIHQKHLQDGAGGEEEKALLEQQLLLQQQQYKRMSLNPIEALLIQEQDVENYYYQFSFKYNFSPNGPQTLLFSYSQPYTFTDLVDDLEQLEEKMQNLPKFTSSLDAKTRTLILTASNNLYYKKEIIGGTRLGMPVFCLEITALSSEMLKEGNQKKKTGSQYAKESNQKTPVANSSNKNQVPYQKRKIVFIIARQHPGETPGSFVARGLIKYLLSDSEVVKKLREVFIFKICPMVNPDGVVVGNNRASISGDDLNRQWDNPDPNLNPEVYCIKQELAKFCSQQQLIQQNQNNYNNPSNAGNNQNAITGNGLGVGGTGNQAGGGGGSGVGSGSNQLQLKKVNKNQQVSQQTDENQLFLFIDLHGHSSKKGCFMFGCDSSFDPAGLASMSSQRESYQTQPMNSNLEWAQVRLFPKIMNKICNSFAIKHCKFDVTDSKQCTSRVTVNKQFKVPFSYTLETSFYGFYLNNDQVATQGGAHDQQKDGSQQVFKQYTPELWEQIGQDVCKSLLQFAMINSCMKKELMNIKSTDLILRSREKRAQNFNESPAFNNNAVIDQPNIQLKTPRSQQNDKNSQSTNSQRQIITQQQQLEAETFQPYNNDQVKKKKKKKIELDQSLSPWNDRGDEDSGEMHFYDLHSSSNKSRKGSSLSNFTNHHPIDPAGSTPEAVNQQNNVYIEGPYQMNQDNQNIKACDQSGSSNQYPKTIQDNYQMPSTSSLKQKRPPQLKWTRENTNSSLDQSFENKFMTPYTGTNSNPPGTVGDGGGGGKHGWRNNNVKFADQNNSSSYYNNTNNSNSNNNIKQNLMENRSSTQKASSSTSAQKLKDFQNQKKRLLEKSNTVDIDSFNNPNSPNYQTPKGKQQRNANQSTTPKSSFNRNKLKRITPTNIQQSQHGAQQKQSRTNNSSNSQNQYKSLAKLSAVEAKLLNEQDKISSILFPINQENQLIEEYYKSSTEQDQSMQSDLVQNQPIQKIQQQLPQQKKLQQNQTRKQNNSEKEALIQQQLNWQQYFTPQELEDRIKNVDLIQQQQNILIKQQIHQNNNSQIYEVKDKLNISAARSGISPLSSFIFCESDSDPEDDLLLIKGKLTDETNQVKEKLLTSGEETDANTDQKNTNLQQDNDHNGKEPTDNFVDNDGSKNGLRFLGNLGRKLKRVDEFNFNGKRKGGKTMKQDVLNNLARNYLGMAKSTSLLSNLNVVKLRNPFLPTKDEIMSMYGSQTTIHKKLMLNATENANSAIQAVNATSTTNLTSYQKQQSQQKTAYFLSNTLAANKKEQKDQINPLTNEQKIQKTKVQHTRPQTATRLTASLQNNQKLAVIFYQRDHLKTSTSQRSNTFNATRFSSVNTKQTLETLMNTATLQNDEESINNLSSKFKTESDNNQFFSNRPRSVCQIRISQAIEYYKKTQNNKEKCEKQ